MPPTNAPIASTCHNFPWPLGGQPVLSDSKAACGANNGRMYTKTTPKRTNMDIKQRNFTLVKKLVDEKEKLLVTDLMQLVVT
jgi:hypothetical protein